MLIAHNCTGYHPRRACSPPPFLHYRRALILRGKKKICFDYEADTINGSASILKRMELRLFRMCS